MPLYSNSSDREGLLYKGRLGEASMKIPEYDVSQISDTRLLSGTELRQKYGRLTLFSYVQGLHVLV